MNLFARSNGFGDPAKLSDGVLGTSDALRSIEIMCYRAVKFSLVIWVKLVQFMALSD